MINDDLTAQVDALAARLQETAFEDCGPLLDAFIRSSGANVMLAGPDGQIADTGSQLAVQTVYEDDFSVVTISGDSAATYAAERGARRHSRRHHVGAGHGHRRRAVCGSGGPLHPLRHPRIEAENLAVRALIQMAPWLLLALLAFSLLCAFGYSRYITRPIVRLNGIAGRMAELDLQWVCGERRRDEIGQLGRSLDKMARRLSAALTDLETANQPCGARWPGSGSWTGSGWPSFPPPPTS